MVSQDSLALDEIAGGANFIKHAFGSGNPRSKYVYHEREKNGKGRLCWCAPGKRTKGKSLALSDVTDIYIGIFSINIFSIHLITDFLGTEPGDQTLNPSN